MSIKPETLLDEVIDEFVIPLANQAIDDSNQINLIALCKKAEKWMDKNCGPGNPSEEVLEADCRLESLR